MPLSMAELEALAISMFAEDVDIPAEATRWTQEEAERYFDSGGEDVPAYTGGTDAPQAPAADGGNAPPPPRGQGSAASASSWRVG